jgi:GNAT superfamily N-acetyltransferase
VATTQRLRRATTADAPVLAELAARLFEKTFGPDNDPADMRAYLAGAFSIERQTEELSDENRVAFIAEDSVTGEPIGYALMRRGSRSDGVVSARPAEVQRIYAVPTWHGRGVGGALMAACVEQAHAWGCEVLWLAVWERNPRAIAFYEKNGFSRVGRTTFQLGSDLQFDHVMARSLS